MHAVTKIEGQRDLLPAIRKAIEGAGLVQDGHVRVEGRVGGCGMVGKVHNLHDSSNPIELGKDICLNPDHLLRCVVHTCMFLAYPAVTVVIMAAL